jgi:hypothetical protein
MPMIEIMPGGGRDFVRKMKGGWRLAARDRQRSR